MSGLAKLVSDITSCGSNLEHKKDTTPWQRGQAFRKVAEHFNLTETERHWARIAMKQFPKEALACYKAIVRSL